MLMPLPPHASPFFRNRYIRFHFAKKDETLHRAEARLAVKPLSLK
jgi:hypothetical protein